MLDKHSVEYEIICHKNSKMFAKHDFLRSIQKLKITITVIDAKYQIKRRNKHWY
jgi:hypothetical protein